MWAMGVMCYYLLTHKYPLQPDVTEFEYAPEEDDISRIQGGI